MRPAIKNISTIDGDDPEHFYQADAQCFSVILRLLIGPAGLEGEESFDVNVCSASWLEKECERDGFVLGRHHLIVRNYDVSLIRKVLVKLIERCVGETWPEVAKQISRLAYWEFEDYQDTESRK